MSWLFDRVREMAAADCVELVVAVDIDTFGGDQRADLVDVLCRASHVPQFTVTLVPSSTEGELLPEDLVETCGLDGAIGEGPEAVERAIEVTHRFVDARARIRFGQMSIERDPGALTVNRTWGVGAADDDDVTTRWMMVTDQPGFGRALARAADGGIAVAVAGMEPHANVHVDDLAGATSILDAIVTMRGVAFGAAQADRVS